MNLLVHCISIKAMAFELGLERKGNKFFPNRGKHRHSPTKIATIIAWSNFKFREFYGTQCFLNLFFHNPNKKSAHSTYVRLQWQQGEICANFSLQMSYCS